MTAYQKIIIARRARAGLLGFFITSVLILLFLTAHAPDAAQLLRQVAVPLVVDVGLLLIGLTVFWLFIRIRQPSLAASVLIAGLTLPQAVYFAFTYTAVGSSIQQVYSGFGLDQADSRPTRGATVDTLADVRKVCTQFAQCYLSQVNTVSFNTDLQGTFLRNRAEPVFQDKLKPDVMHALSGVGHAPFWLSQKVTEYSSVHDLLSQLNSYSGNVSHHLHQVTLVPSQTPLLLEAGAKTSREATGKMTRVVRSKDFFSVSYTADRPLYVNAAVNYDAHWKASVGEHNVPIEKANVGGMVSLVPAGANMVRFEYRNWADTFVFGSRYAFLALAIMVIIAIRSALFV